MTTSTTNKKIGNLYAGLSERERVRMQAKLAREHNTVEMEKLRSATPDEHADAYNHALKLLRVVNGNTLDWIGLFRLGMERDRVRMQAFFQVGALKNRISYQLLAMWRLISYPVTESEYRAIVKRERDKLLPLDAYAEILSDYTGDKPGLHPKIAELLQNLPPELKPIYVSDEHKPGDRPLPEDVKEDIERSHKVAKRLRAIIDDAIKAGELPNPKRKDGELCLPDGVLRDWGQGTTPETYELYGPGLHIPMLVPFQGELAAQWDIRPDSEAEAVKERRRELYLYLPVPPDISEELRGLVRNLEPPLTAKELERDEKRAQEILDLWYSSQGLAELMHAAADSHAEHRAQLDGLREALEIVQREDFYGEDPLFPKIRVHLEAAHQEAERFPPLWESVNDIDTGLREALYKLQGLEPPVWKSDAYKTPAPLPEKKSDTEYMLALIRTWEG